MLFDEVKIEIMQYLVTKLYIFKTKAKEYVMTSSVIFEFNGTNITVVFYKTDI